MRHGLFYTNAKILPGIIDIQSATYDDPEGVPARALIQVADRVSWIERAHELSAFERYPPRTERRPLSAWNSNPIWLPDAGTRPARGGPP
jgi:hypothetical protein